MIGADVGVGTLSRAVARTAIGDFVVVACVRGLRSVTPMRPGEPRGVETVADGETTVHVRAASEYLARYDGGDPAPYGGALDLVASPLHLAVWERLRAIPLGETMTYGDIAAAIGLPGEARAVGAAVAANPLCIVQPCHRVVGADGSLRGFAWGLDLKRRLLAHEGSGALSLF